MFKILKSILILGLISFSSKLLANEKIIKSELLSKSFASKNGSCSLTIGQDEDWSISCEALKNKYKTSELSGLGFKLVVPYGEPQYQGLEFKVRSIRPLQAFIARDTDGVKIVVALIYGSPADGMVEMLFEN